MQTQTQKTNTKTKNTTKNSDKKVSAKQLTNFLNERESNAVKIAFHLTRSQRIGDKFNARYVKNLANQVAKVESTETKIVSAASVLNDFRKGKFSETRLTENRIKAYSRILSNQAGFTVDADAVKRDIMRLANAIFSTAAF